MRGYSISKIFYFILIVGSSLTLHAQKASKEDLEEKKKKLQQEMAELNKTLNNITKNKEITLTELITYNKRISVREEIIATISNEMEILQSQIDDGNDSIGVMGNRLGSLKKEYARMIYDSYKNQGAYNKLMFIFSASDFEQAVMRMHYLEEYEQYEHKQALMIDSTRQDLNAQVERLQKKKDEKKELLASQESEKEQLTKEKDEQQKALAKLQSREKDVKKQLAEKQKAAKKLNEAIHKIIEDEMKKETAKAHPKGGNNSKEVSLTPEAKALSKNFEGNKGSLPWPVVEGSIYKQFGTYSPMPGITMTNNGIDIATTKGAVARAIFKGTVTAVTDVPQLGKVVIVKHGEYFSVYSNLKEVFVKTGDTLSTKKTIGTILYNDEDGKTELHLELWKETNKLNPEEWIHKKE
jgi:septal ring factor EnvC (AmiA/AmiB activator)